MMVLCELMQNWADVTGHQIVTKSAEDKGDSMDVILRINNNDFTSGSKGGVTAAEREAQILDTIRFAGLQNRQALSGHHGEDSLNSKYLQDVKSVLGLLIAGPSTAGKYLTSSSTSTSLADGASDLIETADNVHEMTWIESDKLGGEMEYFEDLSNALLDSSIAIDVKVRFTIKYRCKFGDQLRLVGSAKELGEWDAAEGLQMEWSEGDLWALTTRLPFGLIAEYKYVVVDKDGGERWQDGKSSHLVSKFFTDKTLKQ